MYEYLLTLFSNDPTTKLPIRNLLISIAIPTQLGARSDGRVPTSVGMIERPWLPPSECATLAILSFLLCCACFCATCARNAHNALASVVASTCNLL